MAEAPLQPYDIIVKRGSAKIFRPRFTAVVGTDMNGWSADLLVKRASGAILFQESSSVTVEDGTPHIGWAQFTIPEDATPKFSLGAKQSYYVRLRDTGSWNDIVLHGAVLGTVEAGG
jgi:hypothetical protein